jgi:iron uptake system component EfeO
MTFHNRVPVAELLVILVLLPTACGSSGDTKSDAQLQDDIVSNMRTLVQADLVSLNQAALDLQAAAPGALSGWDPAGDGPAALAAMKAAWARTRDYWERVEGALSPLFPDLDDAMDSRYEDSLMRLGGAGDPDPFDREGVTGMHAIERILFAPGPDAVVTFESSMPGYSVAAWPASDPQAAAFKTGLCQRLVDDTQTLLDQWQSRVIDLGTVFSGLTGQMSAQSEKVSLAASQQEESRYSQTTMVDLRSNLAGTRAIYALFEPWLATKTYGTTLDANALDAFDRLDRTYGNIAGDDIPPPPATWATEPMSADNQHSPFGTLFLAVEQEVDPAQAGSAVDAMNHVARALNLPEFTGQN